MNGPERHHRAIDKAPFNAIGFGDIGNPIPLANACQVQTPSQGGDNVERFGTRKCFPFVTNFLSESVDPWIVLELILQQIKNPSRCLHNEKLPSEEKIAEVTPTHRTYTQSESVIIKSVLKAMG